MLIRWLASITSAEAVRTNSTHDHLRAAVFLGLDKLRKVYSEAGPFLTDAQRESAEHFNTVYHAALNRFLDWTGSVSCFSQLL